MKRATRTQACRPRRGASGERVLWKCSTVTPLSAGCQSYCPRPFRKETSERDHSLQSIAWPHMAPGGNSEPRAGSSPSHRPPSPALHATRPSPTAVSPREPPQSQFQDIPSRRDETDETKAKNKAAEGAYVLVTGALNCSPSQSSDQHLRCDRAILANSQIQKAAATYVQSATICHYLPLCETFRGTLGLASTGFGSRASGE